MGGTDGTGPRIDGGYEGESPFSKTGHLPRSGCAPFVHYAGTLHKGIGFTEAGGADAILRTEDAQEDKRLHVHPSTIIAYLYIFVKYSYFT